MGEYGWIFLGGKRREMRADKGRWGQRADEGRCGQMRADAGRCVQIRADAGRCGQMLMNKNGQTFLGIQSVWENARMIIWARNWGLKNLGNRRHEHLVQDTQRNDIENNDTQHNNTELYATLRINDTEHCNQCQYGQAWPCLQY